MLTVLVCLVVGLIVGIWHIRSVGTYAKKSSITLAISFCALGGLAGYIVAMIVPGPPYKVVARSYDLQSVDDNGSFLLTSEAGDYIGNFVKAEVDGKAQYVQVPLGAVSVGEPKLIVKEGVPSASGFWSWHFDLPYTLVTITLPTGHRATRIKRSSE